MYYFLTDMNNSYRLYNYIYFEKSHTIYVSLAENETWKDLSIAEQLSTYDMNE